MARLRWTVLALCAALTLCGWCCQGSSNSDSVTVASWMLPAANTGPPPVFDPCMVAVSDTAIFFYGGNTATGWSPETVDPWLLDTSDPNDLQWTHLVTGGDPLACPPTQPPPRSGVACALAPAGGGDGSPQVLVWGGDAPAVAGSFLGADGTQYQDDLWLFDLGAVRWIPVRTRSAGGVLNQPGPPGTAWTPIALWPAAGKWVLVGGQGATNGVAGSAADHDLRQLWLLDAATYTWSTPYVCQASVLVCPGGDAPACWVDAPANTSCAEVCQQYAPPGGSAAPQGRDGARFAIATVAGRDELWLFGGYSCIEAGVQGQGGTGCYHNDWWLLDLASLTWTQFPAPASGPQAALWPSPRAYFDLALDAKGRIWIANGGYVDVSQVLYWYQNVRLSFFEVPLFDLFFDQQ